MQDGPIKALVDGTEFEFELCDGVLSVGGQPLSASLDKVGPATYSLLVDGKSYEITLEQNGKATRVTESGQVSNITILDRLGVLLEALDASAGRKRHTLEIRAPMPGLVLKIEVSQDQEVSPGEGVLVLEAMKMENQIFAGSAGIVESVHVETGDAVTKGQLLVTLRPETS